MKHRTEQFGDASLILGDCLEVMGDLEPVDAVVTDPPYGIGFQYESHKDNIDGWKTLMNGAVPLMKSIARFVVLPCCQIVLLPWWYAHHSPDWLIAWHKGSPGHRSKIGFNDWEPHVSWGRPEKPMHDYFSTVCGFDDNGHPCPKPLPWAEWLCKRAAKKHQTILDPFMGSGTTGVACMNLGRKFIGIEIEEKYFDIACRRIELAAIQERLPFEEKVKPKQESMEGIK
ncbi:MAG: site-specific DNA-methyltransferase [Nitrospinaceae bacterium]